MPDVCPTLEYWSLQNMSYQVLVYLNSKLFNSYVHILLRDSNCERFVQSWPGTVPSMAVTVPVEPDPIFIFKFYDSFQFLFVW